MGDRIVIADMGQPLLNSWEEAINRDLPSIETERISNFSEIAQKLGNGSSLLIFSADDENIESYLKDINSSYPDKNVVCSTELTEEKCAFWRERGIYVLSPQTPPYLVVSIVNALIKSQRKEESAVSSDSVMRQVLEEMHHAMCLLTSDSKIVYANQMAGKLLGQDKRKLEGETFLDFVTAAETPSITDARSGFMRALEKQTVFTSENILLYDIKGHAFATSLAMKPLGLNGSQYFSVTFQDITESKLVEDIIRRSREKLFTILDSLDTAVYVSNLETDEILFANKVLWDDHGNVIGKKCWEVMHNDRDRHCKSCSRDLIGKDGNPNGVVEWEEQDDRTGEWRALRTQAIRWYDGSLVRLLIAVDVTPQKSAENEIAIAKAIIEKERDKLRSMIEGMDEGIIVLDENDEISEVNTWMLNSLDRSRDDLIGQPIWTFPVEHITARLRPVLSQFRGGTTRKILAINVAMDNQQISLRVQPIFRNRIYSGIILNFINVTDLIEARNAAEKANLAKSQFLANISHEIRTPIHGVLGMTSLLLGSELTPEQREHSKTIYNSADHLMELLNEVLDFSKIESGEFALDITDFSLQETVHAAVNLLSAKAEEKGLELLFSISQDVPDALIGDGFRLRQVLLNLLSNGIKFTDAGEVSLRIESRRQTETEIELLVTVKDTGIGIPVEKQLDIFKAFSQADTSTTRRFGGTGLGLTISSRIIEMMGGQIWVESQPRKGSVFNFTFMVGIQQNPVEALDTDSLVLTEGLRAMIVDDNATNRKILEEILQQWQMETVSFESAAAALGELARSEADGEPYQLVIIDAHMPKMDGFSLAERIKQNPALARSTVMMLSSGDMVGASARCKQLNISAYLMKPVRQDELLKAILVAIGRKDREYEGVGEKSLSVSQLSENKQMRVLFCEDNVVNQKIVATALRKRGHEVVICMNGLEAISELENGTYDLLLTDVQMPEMDGFELATHVRKRERETGEHLPIIAMTAHALAGDRDRCLDVGMDGYVAKPIDPEELIRILENLDIEPTPPVVSKAPASDLVFNKDALLRRVDNDPVMAVEFIKLFIDETKNHLKDLKAAIDTSDLHSVERRAHLIKGSAISIGAESMSEAAVAIWHAAIAGHIGKAKRLFEKLEEEFIRFQSVAN